MYELDKKFYKNNLARATPPWLYPDKKVDMKVFEMKRDYKLIQAGVKTYTNLRHSYYNYLKIYTDGFKNTKQYVEIRIYILEFQTCISDHLSVLTAEMVAVIISLQWVEEVRPDSVVVCTDSKAVVESFPLKTPNIYFTTCLL